MSKKLLLFLGLGIILMAGFSLSSQRIWSFHFVDEEDHIVTASLMNQGLKLYKDLSVNHQPLVYLGSSWLQKVIQPQNILMLIKWHRLAMFAYAAVWGVILVLRFKTIGLLVMTVFEFYKFYLFGNLWLMESMAVYPAVYIWLNFIESGLKKNWPKRKEMLFLGICSFLVVFNLVPLWPWMAFIWILYLIKNKKNVVWMILGAVVPTVILFLMVPLVDWFRETVFYNLVYAMPRLSIVRGWNDWLRILLFPFFSVLNLSSFQGKVVFGLTFGYLIGLINLYKKDKHKFWWLVAAYPLLVLVNLRVPTVDEVFYTGFHLLPWIGLMLALFFVNLKEIKSKWIWGVFLLIGGVGLGFNKNMPYFWKTDPLNECYVNYSVFDDVNFAVKALVSEGDRMAVLTSESLIYWQTGVMPATRQVVYYAWELAVPELKENYEKVFYGDNPPEFIYGSQEKQLVEKKYIKLLKDNQPTELYIRKNRAKEITQEQMNNLALRRFSL